MKYLLLMYNAEDAFSNDELREGQTQAVATCHELHAAGQYLDASPLHPVSTATSVRVRDGKRQVTNGPFAETTEQLGGYYVIDVPNLDEAIAFASRIPPAKKGTVEVRPIFELENLPVQSA